MAPTSASQLDSYCAPYGGEQGILLAQTAAAGVQDPSMAGKRCWRVVGHG
jgi:hypothetical protein